MSLPALEPGCADIVITLNDGNAPTNYDPSTGLGNVFNLTSLCSGLFSYQPYMPKKEVYYKETATGLVRQSNAYNFMNTGASKIKWELQLCTKPIADIMYKIYIFEGTLLFTGVYNELDLPVDMTKFEVEMIHGYPRLTGEMQILCENATPASRFPCDDTPT